jgi:glycosyltransferase involved in cell wall biosynthesis
MIHEPMRILHVISSIDPRAGGTTTAVAGMAGFQAEAGLSVTVAATYGRRFDDSVAKQLERRGVTVRLVGPARTPLAYHPGIKPLLHELTRNTDVVHIHGLWEEIQHRAARVAHAQGVPYIMTPHGMLDPWCLNQSKLRKKIYLALRLRRDLNQAAAMYFTTQQERKLIEPLDLKPPAIVEPLGVDLDEFKSLPERGTFRAKYPQLGEKRFIIFLSRIHHKKGLDLLIPAFAQLADKEIMLVIAGPDSQDNYRARVEEMIQQHGVADRVIFTGMLHGVERIEALVDAELFTLPSYQENFGIVVIESLAAGTPLVISDQVNVHHEIAAGNVGAVVPTDVGTLASELARWMSDDGLRTAAAERTRPFTWEHFDWNQIGRHWVEHYTRLLAGRS